MCLIYFQVCHKSSIFLSSNNGTICSLDPALLHQGPTHVLKIAVPHLLNNEDVISLHLTVDFGTCFNTVATVLVPWLYTFT